ncbi:MAG TPA: ABC transporter permease [Thermoanaerobaculia bacterium]|nr:ABC transporter permease [Thermoanaerobaculia bacterium]
MRPSDAYVVGKREYLVRIKGWGFWVATFGLPLFMAAMMAVPALLMTRGHTAHRLALVDTTGELAGPLRERLASAEREGARVVDFDLRVLPPGPDAAAQRARLDRMALAGEIDAWIWLDEEDLGRGRFEYHSESVSSWLTQEVLQGVVSEVVAAWRLRRAGFDTEKIAELTRGVDLRTVKVSEGGSSAEGGFGGVVLAIFLFTILYAVLILYGTQVMQGVLEEKTSRIVEVMTSAVRPLELMLGKLVGICCVGLTQVAIWIATAVLLTAPGVFALRSILPAGLNVPSFTPGLVLHFLALFLIGFFLFATLYAMVGAATNNMQEAQHLASFAIVFLVAPMFFFMQVINDPDGRLAVVTSMIPFFMPLVMMLRIAVKTPPMWQLAVAYTLAIVTTCGLVWVCARVYRVGILMYGKRPTLAELWRWVRYA